MDEAPGYIAGLFRIYSGLSLNAALPHSCNGPEIDVYFKLKGLIRRPSRGVACMCPRALRAQWTKVISGVT